MEKPINVIDAAKYLLTLDEDDDFTSHLKLQKLLYYAQGVHLALHGKPLFEDEVQAWAHGPVCPRAYREYKKHSDCPIPKPTDFDPKSLPDEAQETLSEVHRVFGQFSAWRLRDMTHKEPPWENAYREGETHIVISHNALKEYFRTILQE